MWETEAILNTAQKQNAQVCQWQTWNVCHQTVRRHSQTMTADSDQALTQLLQLTTSEQTDHLWSLHTTHQRECNLELYNNKAMLDYTSPMLCTPFTPFPADPIFSKHSSDGMIPCAARRYWRSNGPFCSKHVIVHCQWGRKPLPTDRRCGLSSTCRRRTETDMGNMHKKLVKIAHVVLVISCRTDRQTDIVITILCNRSSRRSKNCQISYVPI